MNAGINTRGPSLNDTIEPWIEQVIDAAPVGILIVDKDGHFALVNRELERIFHYKKGEMGELTLPALIPDRFRHKHAEHRAAFQKAPCERAMGCGQELFGLRSDGTEVPVEIGLHPLEAADQGRMLVTVLDVTQRRRMDMDLLDLNSTLETKNRELERYIHSMKHDLLDPLLTIHNDTELIAKALDLGTPDQLGEHLERITSATTGMLNSIDGFFQSRRRKTLLDKPEHTDSNEVIAGLISTFESDADYQGVRFQVSEDLPLVMVDREQLTLVFQNLIANALMHGRPKTGQPIIDIGWSSLGHEAYFWVADNGPGIPSEFQQSIFSMYTRYASSRDGSGVGLAIVRRIVKLHEGRVWVDSRPGDGSTFCLALPRAFVRDRCPVLQSKPEDRACS